MRLYTWPRQFRDSPATLLCLRSDTREDVGGARQRGRAADMGRDLKPAHLSLFPVSLRQERPNRLHGKHRNTEMTLPRVEIQLDRIHFPLHGFDHRPRLRVVMGIVVPVEEHEWYVPGLPGRDSENLRRHRDGSEDAVRFGKRVIKRELAPHRAAVHDEGPIIHRVRCADLCENRIQNPAILLKRAPRKVRRDDNSQPILGNGGIRFGSGMSLFSRGGSLSCSPRVNSWSNELPYPAYGALG